MPCILSLYEAPKEMLQKQGLQQFSIRTLLAVVPPPKERTGGKAPEQRFKI